MDFMKQNETRNGGSQDRLLTCNAPRPFCWSRGCSVVWWERLGQAVGFLLSLLLDGENSDES